MERFTRMNNGTEEVAVLVSPGYGAGWSTWNPASEVLAADREVVEAYLTMVEPLHLSRKDRYAEALAEAKATHDEVMEAYEKALQEAWDRDPHGDLPCYPEPSDRARGVVQAQELDASLAFLDLCRRKAGVERLCDLGFYEGLKVRWVPKGTRFRVTERDGAEGVEVLDYSNYFTA